MKKFQLSNNEYMPGAGYSDGFIQNRILGDQARGMFFLRIIENISRTTQASIVSNLLVICFLFPGRKFIIVSLRTGSIGQITLQIIC